eukprot:gnl/TRDRNA2_/TRDRNA2_172435_c1_seq6.p1 gnl/TRDRNA2_/TRDRNA2_172435_c1~~gnl/TRDRNA2_/TRDRNA2_172435_c1_seq6.p1  ORF type:complete len:171 (+),score=21.92 gnl/TRDRNA2_/TRDRNA2_172435_c1_seq6:320-832(+)
MPSPRAMSIQLQASLQSSRRDSAHSSMVRRRDVMTRPDEWLSLKSTSRLTAAFGKAVNKVASELLSTANAHADFARSCVLESLARCAAAGASTMSEHTAVAKAHTVLLRFCKLKSHDRRSAARDSVTNAAASKCAAVANAHAVFARPWELKTVSCDCAKHPSAAHSLSSD